jgi:hypothetical protein
VGEFNAVLNANGGPVMMRYEYDTFARYHWAATMWAYKLVKPQAGAGENSWYMVTNADPLPAISLRHSSRRAIMSYLKSMGTIPLAVNRPLLAALTARRPPSLNWPHIGPAPFFPAAAPRSIAMRGWRQADIGGARPGGQRLAAGVLKVYGGGADIFNQFDSFHFLYTPAGHRVTLSTEVRSLLWSSQYAKAGIMLRAGDHPDSPFAMINVFPTHSVAWVCRSKRGGGTVQNLASCRGFPIRIKLVRRNGTVSGYYRDGLAPWMKLGSTRAANLLSGGRIGLAVVSHHPRVLTVAVFSNVRLHNGHGHITVYAAAPVQRPGRKPNNRLAMERPQP